MVVGNNDLRLGPDHRRWGNGGRCEKHGYGRRGLLVVVVVDLSRNMVVVRWPSSMVAVPVLRGRVVVVAEMVVGTLAPPCCGGGCGWCDGHMGIPLGGSREIGLVLQI